MGKMFELDKFGPKKWRKILGQYEAAINIIAPIEGDGMQLDFNNDGVLYSTEAACSGDGSNSGGGTAGTPVDVYGAHNGAPAVFHLLQSSSPSAVP